MQTVVGVLNGIPAPSVPVTLLKVCIWTRWCGGVGVFEQRSRIISPDDQSTIGESRVRFQLREMEHNATNVHCFGGLQFKEFGMHYVEVELDGELQLRFPLPVVEIRQHS